VRKLFIGATFVAMENHRTDSIPNDSYPVKSDRLLENGFRELAAVQGAEVGLRMLQIPRVFSRQNRD
jgi:hypothetical protein